MLLSDLPEDVLNIVFSFLSAKDFLTLCITCRTLYSFNQDPAYWRMLTFKSFRLPASPLLKANGPRWYHLYRRLKTQTHVYTWGQGVRGSLGLGASPRRFGPRIVMRRGPPRPTATFQRVSSTWPTNTSIPEDIKVIADLQCGGWSTSILSSEGKIYVVGIIDSMDGNYVGESIDNFTQLHYLTESTSAISQFSSGRRHILGLTDDGEILSWDRVGAKGLKIFASTGRDFGGRATKVVAGWGESSAYIPETGIVFWTPIKNDQQDEMLDGIHVRGRIVPGSARSGSNDRLIEVVSHVVLEGMIVWITSDSKLYACDLRVSNSEQDRPDFAPFEVPGFALPGRKLLDVQGQYNKFMVFTENDVLAGDTPYLYRCGDKARSHFHLDMDSPQILPAKWDGIDQVSATKPEDIPALQNSNVIKLAFGDHHYQALHADGTVTTYGADPTSCGALGIGDMHTGARFRGLRQAAHRGGDLIFIPAAEEQGRHIWFEPEKRDWLTWLEDTLKAGSLGEAAVAEWMEEDPAKQLFFSQWVEQEGEHWNDGPASSTTTGPETTAEAKPSSKPEHAATADDFHLDPYFTIAIAASGWHSGALVLVDEAKAHAVREKWITRTLPATNNTVAGAKDDDEDNQRRMPGHFDASNVEEAEEVYTWKAQGFPKIKLPGGHIMPGVGDIRPWRDGEPAAL